MGGGAGGTGATTPGSGRDWSPDPLDSTDRFFFLLEFLERLDFFELLDLFLFFFRFPLLTEA